MPRPARGIRCRLVGCASALVMLVGIPACSAPVDESGGDDTSTEEEATTDLQAATTPAPASADPMSDPPSGPSTVGNAEETGLSADVVPLPTSDREEDIAVGRSLEFVLSGQAPCLYIPAPREILLIWPLDHAAMTVGGTTTVIDLSDPDTTVAIVGELMEADGFEVNDVPQGVCAGESITPDRAFIVSRAH